MLRDFVCKDHIGRPLLGYFSLYNYLQRDLFLYFVACLFFSSSFLWFQLLALTHLNHYLGKWHNSFNLQAHIEDVRNIPEALPYFITPKAVDDNSVLLQQLPHWAPCSITQALEFLTPAYKGHPRVMAYVLRVLESYPPERVTFFMPQLVQTLRHDEGVRYNLLKLKFKFMVYSHSMCSLLLWVI